MAIVSACVMSRTLSSRQGSRVWPYLYIPSGEDNVREYETDHTLAGWARARRRAGLTVLAAALIVMDTTEDHWYKAPIYRPKGDLLVRYDTDVPQATPCVQQALAIAHRQEPRPTRAGSGEARYSPRAASFCLWRVHCRLRLHRSPGGEGVVGGVRDRELASKSWCCPSIACMKGL